MTNLQTIIIARSHSFVNTERVRLSVCLSVTRWYCAKSTQPYNLRRRRHSFSLTQKQSSYDDCSFITRMLFYHIY